MTSISVFAKTQERGTVLPFRRLSAAEPVQSAAADGIARGTILVFTGVRYERPPAGAGRSVAGEIPRF